MKRPEDNQHDETNVINLPVKKKRSKLKTALLYLGCLLAIPFICFAFAAMFMEFAGGTKNINQMFVTFERVHFYGVIIQAIIIAAIITFWPKFVDFLVAKKLVKPSEYKKALDYRAKAALFLILYLALIPIGPGRIWGLLISN